MEIVWDEPKRLKNFEARGLDFADLTENWFGTATIVPAKKGRLMAIGELSGITLAVVFQPLGTQGCR